MKLDTNEEILQEAKAITEFKGRDLRQWLYREILLNSLKTKRDELDVLDFKVISPGPWMSSGMLPECSSRTATSGRCPSLAQPSSLKAVLITNWLPILAAG